MDKIDFVRSEDSSETYWVWVYNTVTGEERNVSLLDAEVNYIPTGIWEY